MRIPRTLRAVAGAAALAGLAPAAALAQAAARAADPPPGAVAAPIRGPAELRERLEALLADPALARAHVGLAVQVAETGEVLFENEAEKRFVPASNTKIVTAAVALAVLGPEFRWTTRLVADGPIRGGALEGDLWIVGGGDPRLTREEIAAWPALLREAGIERIEGAVIGDDRAFEPWQWSEGWAWDDLHAGWGAGVSALQLHPNTVRGVVIPGAAPGDVAELRPETARPLPPIRNLVRTGAPGSDVRLRFLPPPEGGPVELRGWVPAGSDSVSLYLANPHPTLHLLETVAARLAAAGIEVRDGTRRAADEEGPARPGWSAELASEPLPEILAALMKPSDNQIAETVLRTLGREAGGGGSAAEGVEVVEETLADWGIEPGAVYLTDGSGLSRYNEVTPNALVRLLRAMWRRPDFPVFEASMPVAAVDGTLRRRLAGTPGAGNVKAKTGSLTSVRALSGYLRDGAGETLIFSLLLNGYDAPGAVAVALEDLLVEQLALYRRPVEPGWPAWRDGAGAPRP
ncbi:MAG: D-alanyl-D-alanine carboxypeptidase/D-alanyl-D-alanine-endopeptidase [Gemmatimonadota bacterium]|nr:D-alanyl-D-alanine carboxypeptidase/D-alanyl-D-alanine-endopeptidase [Gemmatimonadota bacterium]